MRLSDINLLDELERPALKDIRAAFHTKSFAKGAVVCRPDEPDNLIFVVRTGKVRVYLSYADKEFTLALLGPGDIFATHAGTHVQALEDSRLLIARTEAVRRGLIRVPEFTTTMVRVLGHMLQSSFAIIHGLVFKDINDRLLAFLLEQARVNGVPQEQGLLVRLDLTGEQLAQLIGATRQTVSTLMNDLVRAGLIEKRGRGVFFIPDLCVLERSMSSDIP